MKENDESTLSKDLLVPLIQARYGCSRANSLFNPMNVDGYVLYDGRFPHMNPFVPAIIPTCSLLD